MRIFLAEIPKKISQLRVAIAQSDADTVERTAHSLKGELGYLSMTGASQQARKLEEMGRKNDLNEAASTFAVLQAELQPVLASIRNWSETDPKKYFAAGSGAGP